MSANDVVGTLTRGLKEFHLDDSELDDRTVIGESELVRRYDEINAKTMYNMMEEIGDQRLFFLTNHHAVPKSRKRARSPLARKYPTSFHSQSA